VPSCEGTFGNSANRRGRVTVGVLGKSGVVSRVLFEGVALLLREVEDDPRDVGRVEAAVEDEAAVSKRSLVAGNVSMNDSKLQKSETKLERAAAARKWGMTCRCTSNDKDPFSQIDTLSKRIALSLRLPWWPLIRRTWGRRNPSSAEGPRPLCNRRECRMPIEGFHTQL